ncbi:peptidylprolyl isomerase [Blastopirellula marina]|uniref:Probable peptidyl-prolyl cis-trans isomerase n=1 Tax=Blastopirellula marina DSM 3645 TaxID=314230 RepID=A4A0X8_9BACT|nr:peptidyl-prolyl cis-trans isomerase [Blastopirellula marina]EAQ77539.1 probable peptidyl-prolyl cis-trans isomerase [Blastopirellula marina DSM 3645]
MIRRSSIYIFLTAFALSTFGSLPWCAEPAQLYAQGSTFRSWLPWGGKSTSDDAPVDPFKNRGGSATPDYRVAAAPSATAPAATPTTAPLPYPSNPYGATGYTPPSRSAVTTQIGDQPSGSAGAHEAYSGNYTNATTQPWREYPQGAAAWSNQSPPGATNSPQNAYPPRQVAPQPAARPSPYRQSQYGQSQYAPPVTSQYPPAQTPTVNAPPVTEPARAGVNNDKLFVPARIIALVGGQPILAGDILGPVNQALETRIAELSPEQREQVTEEVLEEQRQMALRELLPGLIDTKMIYLDFIRTIPPDKLSEMQGHLDSQYAEYQMQSDLDQYEVHTPAELDIVLRREGSSLEKKKRLFLEQIVASQQLKTHVKPNTEVSHQQMLDYYHDHAADYASPARAKWEQLMVRFDKFSSKAEAEQAIAEMGNQVLRGAPLDAVAKKESQCFRASEGGLYDWTTRNSLKNETIDAAIFSLPTNRLSQIIESPEGYHIVRVLERDEASIKPFRDAQLEIKEKIRRERANQAQRDYVADVRKRTQIWTIFDEEKGAQTASSDSSEQRR